MAEDRHEALLIKLIEGQAGIKTDIANMKEDITEIKGRLCELEKMPARTMEKGKMAALATLISILITTVWNIIVGNIKLK